MGYQKYHPEPLNCKIMLTDPMNSSWALGGPCGLQMKTSFGSLGYSAANEAGNVVHSTQLRINKIGNFKIMPRSL